MRSSTIVVIGGGVIGLSTAYHLALKRVGRVVLLEKESLASGASSRAAGIGTLLMWSDTGVRARQIGFRLFQQFSDEWNDYTFHNEHGCLNLFTSQTWSNRKALLPLYDRLNVSYEVLDAQEIRRRWPALNPPNEILGLYDPRGGYSEPNEFIPALAKRTRELGVEVYEGEPVVEFLRRGDRVSGVRTPRQSIEADATISTVHVWSLPVWRELGLRLPMKHFVHQRYVTVPLPQPFIAPPVNADPYFGYLRPVAGNRILVGVETTDREEFIVDSIDFRMEELSTPVAVRDHCRDRLLQVAPLLQNITWESESIGLISFTSDGEPILGQVQQLPQLFVAASFHSGGFSYSTVAGLLMAELVVDGRTSIEISDFSPNRFNAGEVNQYLATSRTQKHAVHRRH